MGNNRFDIQGKVINQWEGTQDNNFVRSALESARLIVDRETVNQNWRWLNDELSEMYLTNPAEAAACHSYISGWLSGASHVLGRAVAATLR